jgi:hypothetical protein
MAARPNGALASKVRLVLFCQHLGSRTYGRRSHRELCASDAATRPRLREISRLATLILQRNASKSNGRLLVIPPVTRHSAPRTAPQPSRSFGGLAEFDYCSIAFHPQRRGIAGDDRLGARIFTQRRSIGHAIIHQVDVPSRVSRHVMTKSVCLLPYRPPPTGSTGPVTYEAEADISHKTQAATSCDRLYRFSRCSVSG